MFDIVVIGASAGGLQTCSYILSLLPDNFSWPILIVQHLDPSQRPDSIAKIIGAKTNIPVVTAVNGSKISQRHIYLAPPNQHMIISEQKTIYLSSGRKIMYSRPSIDILFHSAAQVYKEHSIGIILTGANSDGAEGVAAIKNYGGYAIIQCPESAYMPTMPQSALLATKSDTVLTPLKIGKLLSDMWLLSCPE